MRKTSGYKIYATRLSSHEIISFGALRKREIYLNINASSDIQCTVSRSSDMRKAFC